MYSSVSSFLVSLVLSAVGFSYVRACLEGPRRRLSLTKAFLGSEGML